MMLKKMFISVVAAAVLFSFGVPAIANDSCLTSNEWAVTMAAQGETLTYKVVLEDGSSLDIYGPFGSERDRYLVFPFDNKGCAMLDVTPKLITDIELRNAFGIVLATTE